MERTPEAPSPRSNTLEDAIDEFLQSGSKSGNYKSNLQYVLDKWCGRLTDRGVTTLDQVNTRVMRDYAQYLNGRIDAHQATDGDEGISASTAWTYYDNVSAFLDYCLKWEYLTENPAQKQRVKDELPERPTTVSGSQQFWSPDQRQQLLRFADQRAADAVDERGTGAVAELRDRALVYVLAYTAVRGGEFLKDSRDTRRTGIRWADIDIEGRTMTVLGKNQQIEPVQLPPETHGPLEQLCRVVNPASEEWPVFISLHAPSMYRVLPDDFERGDNDKRSLLDHCRTLGVVPPALSTNGARSILKRLSEDGVIEVDGEKDYLTLHGARRGIGETLYRKKGAAYAQRALRHKDPKTTSDMYAHIDASEMADGIGDVLDDK